MQPLPAGGTACRYVGCCTLPAVKGIQSFGGKELRITAGNSCPTNDGVSAALLMSEKKALALGLTPLARIVGIGVGGVKPQIMGAVLQEVAGSVSRAKLLISVAAGVPVSALRAGLGKPARLIRVMPNTPALVLEGVTAIARSEGLDAGDLELAQELFAAVGRVVVLDEDALDAVTGLSGSGPAYVAIVIESLADGGVRMGLDRATAMTLATQTVLGSARLILETGMHPAQLKDMVSSPGGTTIAGITALEEGGVRRTFISAVERATLRSRELGGKR